MLRHHNQPTHKTTILVVVLLCLGLGTAFLIINRSRLTPRSADIFVISEPLNYGDTILTGTLRKDVPAGSPGTFILVLASGQPILLDFQGIDPLLGQKVEVTGFLSPPTGDGQGATMSVRTMTATTP